MFISSGSPSPQEANRAVIATIAANAGNALKMVRFAINPPILKYIAILINIDFFYKKRTKNFYRGDFYIAALKNGLNQ
jgi:hypothetical protein